MNWYLFAQNNKFESMSGLSWHWAYNHIFSISLSGLSFGVHMMTHMLAFSSIFNSSVYCVIMFGEFVVVTFFLHHWMPVEDCGLNSRGWMWPFLGNEIALEMEIQSQLPGIYKSQKWPQAACTWSENVFILRSLESRYYFHLKIWNNETQRI